MKFTQSALAVSLAMCAQVAMAQDFSQTVFFGDSLTDTGRLKAIVTGIDSTVGAQLQNSFTTNPDAVWATHLANALGSRADANTTDNTAGTNYAVGGARSGSAVTWNNLFEIPTTNTQIISHLAANQGKADPDALYTVWIGSNDLIAAADPTKTTAEALAAISGAVKATATDVATLDAAGAGYILVPNVPDLSLTPRAIYAEKVLGVTGATAQARLAASLYNSNLYAALNTLDANVIPANTFGLLQEVAADPSAFGFSNTTGVACNMPARTTGANDPASTSLACTPANLVTPTANEDYLFADDIHPSGRTHRILAQYYQSLLSAPSAIGQLPSAITRQGTSDYQALNRRLETLPTNKNSVWIDGGVSNIDSNDATTDTVNPSVTIGAGFGGERSHTGAYAKFGWENYQLSDVISADVQSRGVGLYHRHELDKVGINLQAGVDRLSVDTDRQIAWEGAARTHNATAKGTRLHAGAQVGVTLGTGAVSYRPYLGVNAQEVTIKDLVENNSELATAMRFHNQKQTSLQGEIGVNAAYQLADKHRLYGGVGYTHEFKDDARQVSASLTSIPQYTRGFSLPVAATDGSGVHAHLGVMTKLNDQFAINATVSANHANSNEQDVAGVIGVQAQF
ncbi:autotransporter domain-containing protein [Moraxella pluranimalium]|uniref:Autotransporter domain-containing protein n=1 Tax=Moraxella pluranimalium TaxID=470453 RepID=A0A1T0CF24_9GAMM|nr:autotransporter domain-containing protein [Moraxella pluranimalium]OOS20925.1 hypothetical protein B0680_10255 [Moraxella pluranimalium]